MRYLIKDARLLFWVAFCCLISSGCFRNMTLDDMFPIRELVLANANIDGVEYQHVVYSNRLGVFPYKELVFDYDADHSLLYGSIFLEENNNKQNSDKKMIEFYLHYPLNTEERKIDFELTSIEIRESEPLFTQIKAWCDNNPIDPDEKNYKAIVLFYPDYADWGFHIASGAVSIIDSKLMSVDGKESPYLSFTFDLNNNIDIYKSIVGSMNASVYRKRSNHR